MAGFNVIPRSISLLIFFAFLSSFILVVCGVKMEEDIVEGEKSSNLFLTDKNWDQMLEGEWMIKFYAPWCPACRAMEETWERFAEWAAINVEHPVKVGSVDVTAQPALNGRFMITALPTIYHVIKGEFRQYTASRDLQDFKGFVNKEEWKEISPVSSWTSPTSVMMSTISKLFSFSMELKSYHNTLNNDYGFPTWLSMLLFGLLIITVGLLLGMVLVLVSDYFWGGPQYDVDDIVINKKDADRTMKNDDFVQQNCEKSEDIEKKENIGVEQKNEGEIKDCVPDDSDTNLR